MPVPAALRAAFAVALIGGAALAAATATAQDAAYTAALYSGECGDLTEEIAALEPVALPVGGAVGPADAVPVAESRSALPMAVGDTVGLRLVLAVTDPDEPETVLACGRVGGVFDSADALSVALSPVGGSGVFGVAHFDATGVSLFVAAPDAALGGATPAP